MSTTSNSLSDLMMNNTNVNMDLNSSETLNVNNLVKNKIKHIKSVETDSDILDSPESSTETDNKSLFNDNAYIDYARIIENGEYPSTVWENFKLGSSGFIPNINTIINEPIMYNSIKDTQEDVGLDVDNLVEWSKDKPQLRLRFQDFAYCKRLGYYPNNRLVVLRRFRGGIPDNLFDYIESNQLYSKPLSTMISWIPPEDEHIITMTFNENWNRNSSGVMDIIKTDNKTTTDTESLTDATLQSALALVGDTLSEKYKKEDGTQYSDNSASGNPNLIKQSMVRETGGAGLESNISFVLTFEYEMRYTNKLDPGVVILDLLSNCIRMGTSTESFLLNNKALLESEIIKQIMQNDIDSMFDTLTKEINDLGNNIVDKFKSLYNVAKKTVTDTILDPLNSTEKMVKFITSRYREAIKGAISADTGLPSGHWHLTIGNPKSPIVSIGDLVITKSEVKLGNELGYNDFPTTFKVIYTLQAARSRGLYELQRIFNTGRGRLYVYKDYTDNPDYFKTINNT